MRHCHPPTHPPTHTRTHAHTLCGGWWVVLRESWLSRFGSSVTPCVRQTPRKNESFITISRLARLTDVTAGHQIPQILSFVTLEKSQERKKRRFTNTLPSSSPMLQMLQQAQYGKQILDNTMTSPTVQHASNLPKQHIHSLGIDFVAISIT